MDGCLATLLTVQQYFSHIRMDKIFTSFLIEFQLYQDNGKVIMKGYVPWNPMFTWKVGLESRVAR